MAETDGGSYPRLLHTVLDATDVRALAEFYRRLLGMSYRSGDENPLDGPEPEDWLVLTSVDGATRLAFQSAAVVPRSTWPADDVPQQLHLDFTVPDIGELERHRERALELGAEILLDRTNDPDEPLYVFADPAGHPFCIFVG